MTQKSVKKYIEIVYDAPSGSGLTNIWWVHNKRSDEDCGDIRWHGAFRKYCFFPAAHFLFDADCLRIVAAELDILNVMHREAKKLHDPNTTH